MLLCGLCRRFVRLLLFGRGWSPALCSPVLRGPGRRGGGWGSGGMQGGPSGVDEVVPGPAAWQPEAAASAAANDLPGGREDPQPQALWLPAAHCRGRGPGQCLGPGQEIRGERDDLEPDLVLGVAVQREVPQAGVLEPADAVLGAGTLPVPDF